MKKRMKKNLLVILISIFAIILTLVLFIGGLFMFSSKEKKEELKAAARKLLERPIKIEMVRPKQAPAEPVKPAPDEILVDDFDVGLTSGVFYERKNRIGSYQGTWAMRPSFSIITKSTQIRRGDHGQSLVIDYKKEGGWCGYYTLLNNIDVSKYNTLSFWVRGEKGGEKFDVGLADARMQELEIDAFFMGCITSFVSDGFITTEWKKARVPLARASSEIDLAKMGSFVLWFKYGGEGRIYLEDIKFENDPEVAKIQEYNLPQAPKDLLHPRSMWVWKTDPVNNITQRKDLLDFCKRADISIMYLFFPEFTTAPEQAYIESMAEFLRESHKAGVRVEALTGNPVWSLAENHHLLINWIRFFLEYNKSRPQDERIDGVSLDVEPYLTAEWQQAKERIKGDYISLLKKCRELVNTYQQVFRIGVAIPFFYDKEDDGKFEKQILEYVDYLALMDYYDTAKDIIDHARFHIEAAKEASKKVAIAIETQDLVEMHQGKRRNTFIEEGWEEMERQLEKVKEAFLYESSFEGFGIHYYDSYKLMTRGRNVPTKGHKVSYTIKAKERSGPITIDGNLNDWDLTAPHAVLEKKNVLYGASAWARPEDLSYKTFIEWDENALYIAIDVTDDKIVQQKTGPDMWEGDHTELWLDIDCAGDWIEAVNSDDDFQFGLSPGDFDQLKPEVYIWTPTLPDEVKYKDIIEIVSSKNPDGYIVETRIPGEVLFSVCALPRVGIEPQKPQAPAIFSTSEDTVLSLHKGFKMGIMVDVGDTDDPANPMKLLMSTSEDRIWGDPTTFGMVELE